MMRGLLAMAILCTACTDQPSAIEDPIDGIPADQQLTITRRTVDQKWPLTIGKGTLGCHSGAVVFRAGGTTYALNDAARAQGFAAVDPIRAPEPSPPPSNPLKGTPQDERMRIFVALAGCDSSDTTVSTSCTRQVGARYRLGDADLGLIRDEGRERSWPPLERRKADLTPLVDRGMKLCKS